MNIKKKPIEKPIETNISISKLQKEHNMICTLGESLYHHYVSMFQEVFERKSKFKIILTRRCFSLYKTIEPILSFYQIKNLYGEIITDNALPLRINEISEVLMNQIQNKDTDANSKSDSVIIVDDIIIYGRTINNLLDKIISEVRRINHIQDEETAHMILNHMRVLCITQNLWNSKIKQEYKPLILTRSYSTPLTWKRKSCRFSEIIKSSDVANTSYVVSYKKRFTDDLYNAFYTNIANDKFALENTSDELKKLNVKSYAIKLVNFNDFIKNMEMRGYLRIYFYESLNSIMVSPLVILGEMPEEKFNMICEEIEKKLCNKKTMPIICELLNSKDTGVYSVKTRLVHLLLSHVILVDFLNHYLKNELNDSDANCINNFDYEQIIKYNFNCKISNEFIYFHTQFCSDAIFQDMNLHDFYSQTKIVSDCEDKLSTAIFKRAMQDNKAAIEGQENRLAGMNITDASHKRILDFAFTRLLSFIDNGIATLKSFFDEETNSFLSAIYPGEQAFRIMYDKFEDCIPLLYQIENISDLHELNPYQFYRDCIDKLPDDMFKNQNGTRELLHEYINILEATKQQISDVYAYMDNEEDSFYNQNIENFLTEVLKQS